MDVIRSFIAIDLPANVRADLASLVEKLKTPRYPFVKWVETENLHLTIKFLGNVTVDSLPRIIDAMSTVARSHYPFELQITGIGAFPNWQRPQVVWVGMGSQLDKLNSLQKELENALSPLGFPPENRAFSAHITLGRLRERVTPNERRRFAQFAQNIKFEVRPSFEVNTIRLMKSQLTPAGPIYSELASAKLGQEPQPPPTL